MEKLKQAVKEIAYYRHQAKFSKLHLSLIPFLSLASSLYGALLYIRQSLYRSGFFSKNRLPVPVISVGNLTWGGNGKTPMAEFIAKRLADYGISPLILTRVLEQKLKDIKLVVQEIKESLPIFYTRMTPSYFFELRNISKKMHLGAVLNAVVLCVSAIGSPYAFVRAMEKIGPLFVDRFDFSDHYSFQLKDIQMMRGRLRQLEDKFGYKPIVIVTEKDYDRDPEILKHLHPFKVLVLCSEMQIIPCNGCNEDSFKSLLKELLEV
ncbi:hypothetical protein ES319_D01G083600v1 [Gossypium barbadense]|uniref:tetraacyldisaccharide 4'-kinase n=1 Tax=Gossypium barbadense TaxID=3634 RepID=A0A5J5SRQ9_GOSBA|nr:hypothetical protein ES319_D01G083600v1 [Gossypium barbadense]